MGGLDQFFSDATEFLPILMSGLVITVAVTLAALVISVLLGAGSLRLPQHSGSRRLNVCSRTTR